MIQVAVLGYGTIGSGAVRVLAENAQPIAKRSGTPVEVKYILDLRDFPGDEFEDKIVHDFDIIMNDPDISVVVECMGGTGAAYTFVKAALESGRSVVTSNKELVAQYGAQLIALAREKNINFLFEASVGGGIPIIRPLLSCLTADVIEKINGILNGTTNYILTKMEEEGIDFATALSQAQALGYAELHPEADVEGYDACRKIAILSSLAWGRQVDYQDIHTEGITKITEEDIRYARAAGYKIRLLGSSWKTESGEYCAMVAPFLVAEDNPLAGVRDVFNAIFVRGNMVDDTMFYGKGAGSLPTASAVVADVVDCVRNMGKNIRIFWDEEKCPIKDYLEYERRFFVRMPADTDDDRIAECFGRTEAVAAEGMNDKAFITDVMKEKEFEEACTKAGSVISGIRLD